MSSAAGKVLLVIDLYVGSPTSLALHAHAHFHPSTLTRLPDTGSNSTSISLGAINLLWEVSGVICAPGTLWYMYIAIIIIIGLFIHTHTHTRTHTHRYCRRLWIGCYHSLMSATEIRRSCDCNGRLLWRYEY